MIYLTIDPPADEPTTEEEMGGAEAPAEGSDEPATGTEEQPAA